MPWILGLAATTALLVALSRATPAFPAVVNQSAVKLVPGHWYQVTTYTPPNRTATPLTQEGVVFVMTNELRAQGFYGALKVLAGRNTDGSWSAQSTGAYTGGQGGLANTPNLTVLQVVEVVAPPGVPAQLTSAAFPTGPAELAGTTVSLTPKTAYLAKLHLSAPLSWVVSKSAVESKAASMGFNPVSVWTASPPPMFPDASPESGGDTYFIAGTYNGAPQTLDRPSQLTRAWALPPTASS